MSLRTATPALAALALLVGAACDPEPPGPPPGDDDDAADDDDVVLPDEVHGEISLVFWPADADFPRDELHLHAAFSSELVGRGYEDPVGWISGQQVDVFSPGGWWPLPELGAQAFHWFEDIAGNPRDFTYADAGEWVAVGEVVANVDDLVLDATGMRIYDQPIELGGDAWELQPIDEPLDVELHGGADIPAARWDGAVVLADAPRPTNVDAERALPVRFGRDMTLSWEPSEEPDTSVVVALNTGIRALVTRVDDAAGSVTLPWTEFADFPPFFTATMTRYRRALLDHPAGGSVAMTTRSVMFLYGEAATAWRVEPSRLEPGTTVDVEVSWFDGSFHDGAIVLDPGPDITVLGTMVTDLPGHHLVATLEVGEGADTGARNLVAGAGATTFTATRALWLAEELQATGSCADVLDEDPTSDGGWTGTLGGLDTNTFDTLDCAYFVRGPQQPIRLEMQAGQRLEAEMGVPGIVQPTLLVASECGATETPILLCDTAPDNEAPARLRYTALEDGEVFVVATAVSAAAGSNPEFDVDLRRSDPLPFATAPAFIDQGTPHTVTLTRIGGDWTQGDLTVDLGADIAVDSVTVPGGVGPVAEVAVTVGVDADPGRRGVQVQTGAGTESDAAAIDVRGYVGWETCELAELDPVTRSMPAYTDTTGGPYDGFGGHSCNPKGDLMEGPEKVVRITVGPSETLRVTSTVDDLGDVQLYLAAECGGPPILCVDADVNGGAEHLRWVAPAEGADVYLVVDTYDDDGGQFLGLEIDIEP